MTETVNEHCVHEDCVYRMPLGNTRKSDKVTWYCAYCARTGHARNCPPSRCDKYVKGTEERKMKITLWDGRFRVESEEE